MAWVAELFQAKHPWFFVAQFSSKWQHKTFCRPLTCFHCGSTHCPATNKRTFWELITFYFYMTNPSLWVVRSLRHVSLASGNWSEELMVLHQLHNSAGCPAPPLGANRRFQLLTKTSTEQGKESCSGAVFLYRKQVPWSCTHSWAQHK